MTPIYNPYIGRQNRPIIKIQRTVSTLVNSDNCGLMPANLSIFHLFGILANMFQYFCSLHSEYTIVYCCCCRGFYCLQLFVFVCRREKISVKSNKIFSTETILLKTQNIDENLPLLYTQVQKSSLAANYLSMFRMHSLFPHLTLRHRIANMLTLWCGKCVENDNKSQSRELQNITIHSDGNIGSYFPLESVITYNTQQNSRIFSPPIFIPCLEVTFRQKDFKF